MDPIILKLNFGIEQKPLIDHVIRQMQSEGGIVGYSSEIIGKKVSYRIEFQNVWYVYVFGHDQASLGSDISKLLGILANDYKPDAKT